jgi:hypothetical protein
MVPVYALPNSREDAPLEITIVENYQIHRLRFVHREDLFAFQQALTGFKVVDNYAEYGICFSPRRWSCC